MATWTKIEDGMKQGGSAIQAALESVNGDAEAGGKKTTWTSVTLQTPFTVDDTAPRVWRVGSQVHFVGCIKLNAAKTGTLFNIPDGYKPTRDIHLDVPQKSGNMAYQGRIYVTNGAVTIVAVNGDTSIWIDGLSYDTNDDFPD